MGMGNYNPPPQKKRGAHAYNVHLEYKNEQIKKKTLYETGKKN